MNKAAQAYFQTKVSTTDQGQLLLMLYDGALNYLQQARDKMIAKDYAAKGLLISKVIDIVNELSCTLNMEKGGTLAENLNNLYFLCTARLLQANLKMNVEQLDSVSGILSGLRSAYAQIIETPEAQKAAAQIANRLNAAASMSQRAAPIMAPPVQATGAVGQMQARAAYGQQAGQSSAPVAAAQAPVAAPMASAPVAAPVLSVDMAAPAPSASPATLTAPVPSAPLAGAESAASLAPHAGTSVRAFTPPSPAGLTKPKASPVPQPQAAPAAQPAPTGDGQGLSPAVGLTRRVAGYGKFAQGA